MIVILFGTVIAATLEVAYGTPDRAAESASVAFFLGVLIAGKLDDLRS